MIGEGTFLRRIEIEAKVRLVNKQARTGFLNLVSILFKNQIIDDEEKKVLKELVLQKNEDLIEIMGRYKESQNWDELSEGIRQFLSA